MNIMITTPLELFIVLISQTTFGSLYLVCLLSINQLSNSFTSMLCYALFAHTLESYFLVR